MTRSPNTNCEIELDALALMKTLAGSLDAGRRVSTNRTILDFVLSLHELVYGYQHREAIGSTVVLGELSRSVSDLLPASLSALNAAIEAERRPFATQDDGDPLNDAFVDGVKARYQKLDADLAVTPAADVFLVALRCFEGLRVSILAEFQRQGFDASTRALPVVTW